MTVKEHLIRCLIQNTKESCPQRTRWKYALELYCREPFAQHIYTPKDYDQHQHYHRDRHTSTLSKMETIPMFDTKSNNQQERDEISASSYGATDSCPPGYFDNPPLYTRRDAAQALGPAQYSLASTTLELAEIELQAIRIANRRSRQHDRVRRPQQSYDMEAAEERDIEAELQGWKTGLLEPHSFLCYAVRQHMGSVGFARLGVLKQSDKQEWAD